MSLDREYLVRNKFVRVQHKSRAYTAGRKYYWEKLTEDRERGGGGGARVPFNVHIIHLCRYSAFSIRI